MPLSENQIVVPALLAIENAGGSIQTSELIDLIADQFVLDEADMTQLLNRNDERYTQIVRNLKSHDTLTKRGLAVDIEGGFRITNKGRNLLVDCGFILEE